MAGAGGGGKAGLNNFADRKGREAAAHLSGRRKLGGTARDVITARSQLQTVAAASARGELVATAAAWNCGVCVCPSAAGREAEGRGGEGPPALELGGGLWARGFGRCPSLLPPAAPAPSQHRTGVPTQDDSPPTPPAAPTHLVPPKRDVQVSPGLSPESCPTYLFYSERLQ